jgi:hypothetical protein
MHTGETLGERPWEGQQGSSRAQLHLVPCGCAAWFLRGCKKDLQLLSMPSGFQPPPPCSSGKGKHRHILRMRSHRT